jgi:hypothetical protein
VYCQPDREKDDQELMKTRMKYLLGLALSWLVVRSVYRSYWALGIERVEEVKPEASKTEGD